MRRLLFPALFAALTLSARADVKIGDRAPDFEAEFLGLDAHALSDLRGRVVLIDFWRTWCEPCRKQFPHMNELEARYAARGLVVLGITNEPRKLVRETLEATKAEFPVALVKGDAPDKVWGITSFPTSFLIDAQGRVVWSGHPGSFDEKLLDELFEDVLAAPAAKYPELAKLYAKQQYGRAHEGLEKYATAGEAEALAAKRALESVLERRLQAAQSLAAAGDVALAAQRYAAIAESFAGMSAAAPALAAKEALEKDAKNANEFEAQKLFERAEGFAAAGDEPRALATWDAVLKRYKSTKVAERAQHALRQRGH